MVRGFDRYNRGDFDALREYIADDVIVDRIADLPQLHGWDAFRRQLLEPDAFEWIRMHPRSWVINGDRVLLQVDIHAKGAGSGIEMDLERWMVWTVRDDIVTRIASFIEEAAARADAGLPGNAS